MNTDFFIGLAIAINRAVEAFKRVALDRFLAGDERANVRATISLALSLLLGVAAAFVLGANMFPRLGIVPLWAGILVTGLVVGGGSNLVHAAIELMTKVNELLGARVQVVESQARTVKSETVLTSSQIERSEKDPPKITSIELDLPEAG